MIIIHYNGHGIKGSKNTEDFDLVDDDDPDEET